MHSRDELNFIKETVLLDEKDNGLVVSFTFIHSYVVLEKHPTSLDLLIYKLERTEKITFYSQVTCTVFCTIYDIVSLGKYTEFSFVF